MTKEEKFTAVTVYLAKVVDHLKGYENEHNYIPSRRPHTYRSPGSQVPPDQQVQGVLHGISETIADHPAGEKHPRQEVRPSEVAGTSSGDDESAF
jgi:hypothetical protein